MTHSILKITQHFVRGFKMFVILLQCKIILILIKRKITIT